MNIKDVIDTVLYNFIKRGELMADGERKDGYQQALDQLMKHLDMLLTVDDIDSVLDQEHDAVFYLDDNRLYRLDKVSEGKPFIEPVTPGFGGRKRYVEGTKLNGLFPGVMLSAPNYYPKW